MLLFGFGVSLSGVGLGRGGLQALPEQTLGFRVESNDAIDEHRFGSAWTALIAFNQ